MTTQIKFTKDDPQFGNVEGIVRIKGKHLFFKFNNHDAAKAMIAQMQSKGASITQGNKWIRVNMFATHTNVKLGNHTFDVDETTKEKVEDILTEFYQAQYTRAGCNVETTKI